MDKLNYTDEIKNGKAVLGIELGSTRIKAALIGSDGVPLASGSHSWENRLENGIWTYRLEDVWTGVQDCYRSLCRDTEEKYGVKITRLAAVGFSAMMHGYLVFDKNGRQLAEFRTWRNTMTAQAAEELTTLFDFNIPQRWSIAHLYQAILNGEEHIPEIDFMTTLAGYIHYKLTEKRVLGVGEASGVFPIDSETNDYDERMIKLFDEKAALGKGLREILPEVLTAGENAGCLTPEGALLLDPTGTLESGIPLCPPEGDAGTGMVATNSVRVRTGNISAGTSIFAMAVLEKGLSGVHPEIDMVTTPDGKPVAMVHCNNCCSEIDKWVGMFRQITELTGNPLSDNELYEKLYSKALDGAKDCGGVICCNYLSGEPVTQLDEGRPMVVRMPDAELTLENFIRSQLLSAIATLKIGMDILFEAENVKLDRLTGHGGLFKTGQTGQKLMAAAMNTPVSVMETAGEGGAWGIALLALYMISGGEELSDFLDNKIFGGCKGVCCAPDKEDVSGFERYMAGYRSMLEAERAAVNSMK